MCRSLRIESALFDCNLELRGLRVRLENGKSYGLNATLEELMMYNAALSEVEIYDDWVKGLK